MSPRTQNNTQKVQFLKEEAKSVKPKKIQSDLKNQNNLQKKNK
jgi:hypothetical protein